VLINYTNALYTGYQQVSYTKPTRRYVTPGRVAAVGIYAGAATIGGITGGLPGMAAGVIAVPEVITIPLILA
jgi:hypothetical protein